LFSVILQDGVVGLRVVRTEETFVYAFLGCIKVQFEGLVCVLRAGFGNEAEALGVYFFDVVPPLGFVVLLGEDAMQTRLTEVFHHDVCAGNAVEVVPQVVGCAVCSV